MSEVTRSAQRRPTGAADPFVTQVTWLVTAVGGKDQLAQRCGGLVSSRTLDNWTAGNYPRAKVTGAVRDLDAWAAAHVPGYPQAAGVPRLVDSCGPNPVLSLIGTPHTDETPSGDDAPSTTPARDRRWLRWVLAAAVLVAVAAASSLTTLLIVGRQGAAKAPDPAAVARTVAGLPLPSTGDGKEYPEQSGHIGANTFADPRTLVGRGQTIPPNTTIQVRCRYYAPSVPSVTPDGFWYLVDSDQWAGHWTPANSFMNGDVPGGPTLHNTDFAVPICK